MGWVCSAAGLRAACILAKCGTATEIAPFRLDHFDPANLGRWAAVGYDPLEVAEFLSVTEASLNHPNVALNLRMKHAVDVW